MSQEKTDRNSELIERYKKGEPVHDLMKFFKLSRGRIFFILSRVDAYRSHKGIIPGEATKKKISEGMKKMWLESR